MKRILSAVAFYAALAVAIYFVAPPSWFQFGVFDSDERKTGQNFTLARLDGAGDWNFGELRGQVVVVNYWATWCGPCRYETPGLVRVSNEFAARGVQFVGVTVDDDLAPVQPFIERYGIKYPILLPGNDPQLGKGQMLLPTTFLYDRNGRVAKKYTGYVAESTLRSDIEELLKES